jgi:hypothetical protein
MSTASIFHACNEASQRFMEYVREHGAFQDIPVERLVAAWEEAYGRDRVQSWIKSFETSGGRAGKHFEREDVLDG